MSEQRYRQERARIEQGHVKYREKLRDEGKLALDDPLIGLGALASMANPHHIAGRDDAPFVGREALE